MALLIRIAVLGIALAGCYAPDLRDCTVTCGDPSDCADGQSCTNGFCVAPGMTCEVGEQPDAAVAPPPVMTVLHVVVMGRGRVEVKDVMTCDTDCHISVPRGVEVRLIAIEIDHEFDKWTSVACANQGKDCRITPATAALDVAAKFK